MKGLEPRRFALVELKIQHGDPQLLKIPFDRIRLDVGMNVADVAVNCQIGAFERHGAAADCFADDYFVLPPSVSCRMGRAWC